MNKDKLTSARFWVVLMLTSTACAMAIRGNLQNFDALVMMAVGWYFGRNDRTTNQ